MQSRLTSGLAASVVFFLGNTAWSQTVTATQTHPSGVYTAGEKVSWTIQASGDGVASLTSVPYAIKTNLMTVLKEGTVDLSKGSVQLDASLDQPGTLGVSMKLPGGEKPERLVAGAIVSPQQIKPSAPPPDDFEQFWKEKVAAAEAIALNPEVEKGKAQKTGVEYYKVRLDNINGTHVYGQLAKPAKPGKLPGLVIFQPAGMIPLPPNQVISRAMNGYLAFNIMAHDLPMDESAEFYKKALETTHKNAIKIGADDREKSYFLRMYLGCYQAVRYLTTRDDWDGQTLIVMGASQGGMQALATAGLHPKVTAVIADVPAGCDATGVLAGRFTGFPYWRGWGSEPNKKTIEVGRYFDVVNFAPRIKVPALVAMGLIDDTCPAMGVMSAFNQIQGPKERIIMPVSNHYGTGGAQKDYFDQSNAWLASFAKGQTKPDPKQPQ
jgi:cephalosporin-C deacetylase-like acetyl esterase